MRKLFRSAALAASAAGLALVVGAAPAGAWSEYCDWDPVVAVVTPAGNVVLVYDSVWTGTPLNVGLPVESYTATRAYDSSGRPVTDVDMAISVPTGLLFQFQTLDEVTSGALGSGQVLAQAGGWSGQTLHLKFVIDQA